MINIYLNLNPIEVIMNLKQTIKFLAEHGVHQLRKGESVADALDAVKNGTERKGYQVKTDWGRDMTENEIIAASNKEAFMKTVKPKEYLPIQMDYPDDICVESDYRENNNERGLIVNCYYCGDCIRIDGEGDDYSVSEPEIHCDDCLPNAIAKLAM